MRNIAIISAFLIGFKLEYKMSLFLGTLTTGNLLNGVLLNAGLFISTGLKILYATLTTTLVPSIGNFSPIFNRSTTASVTDFEGIIRLAKSGEARFEGARRVENLLANSTTLSSQGVSVVSGTVYTLSFYGTGSVVLSGGYSGSISGTGALNRVQSTFTATSTGTLTITVTGSVTSAQLENVTGQSVQTAGEYVSTNVLSAPYHGANVDGVKYFTTKLDGSAIPDATLKGYLAEGQRTNLLTYSEQFDDASWAKGDAIIIANATTAPDGKNTADKLQTTVASNPNVHKTLSSYIPDTDYTESVWIKAGNITEAVVQLYRNGGGTVTHTDARILYGPGSVYGIGTPLITVTGLSTTQWTRVSVTGSPIAGGTLNAYVKNRISGTTVGDYIYIWGIQLEKAGFASSYIPAPEATVTRNADNYNISSGAYSDVAGSAYAEVTAESWANVSSGGIIGDGTNKILAPSYTVGAISYDGTTTANGPTATPSGKIKMAVRWGNGKFRVFVNGAAGTEANYDGAFSLSSMLIGNGFYGNIKEINIWNNSFSDAVLMSMTS